MRTRRPALDHTEAVARRLAALSAELEAERAAEAIQLDLEDGDTDSGVERTVVRVPARRLLVAQDAFAEPVDPYGEPAEPGRHAARRRSRLSLDDDEVRGQWGPGQVSVILGGLVLALAVTCLWLVFGTTQDVVTPVAARIDASSAASSSAASSSAAQSRPAPSSSAPASSADAGTSSGQRGEVVVDVAGKVKRPGLVVLPIGSRVADALEQAGGARRGVDLTGLNLARVLVDGEQILVGVEPHPGATSGSPVSPNVTAPDGTSSGSGAPVSINQADAALLDSLPGVGPVTASAIIAWRTEHGGFSDVRELLEVNGIGEKTLAELLPHVTL